MGWVWVVRLCGAKAFFFSRRELKCRELAGLGPLGGERPRPRSGDGTMEPELTKMKTAETQSRGTRLADEKSKKENGRLARDRWPLLLVLEPEMFI